MHGLADYTPSMVERTLPLLGSASKQVLPQHVVNVRQLRQVPIRIHALLCHSGLQKQGGIDTCSKAVVWPFTTAAACKRNGKPVFCFEACPLSQLAFPRCGEAATKDCAGGRTPLGCFGVLLGQPLLFTVPPNVCTAGQMNLHVI